jgi:hypothetical protein
MYSGKEADEIEATNQEDTRMKRKGKPGPFEKKIATVKNAGGVMKKKGIFAQNMKAVARKRAHRK